MRYFLNDRTGDGVVVDDRAEAKAAHMERLLREAPGVWSETDQDGFDRYVAKIRGAKRPRPEQFHLYPRDDSAAAPYDPDADSTPATGFVSEEVSDFDELNSYTKADLQKIAEDLGIEFTSKTSKADLVEEILEAREE